ncbi:MAG: hypothetical protein LBG22_05295 [Treponema sp.]|jgi:hypothetical protein|nr:hypothetical protein [Treponema sp.]
MAGFDVSLPWAILAPAGIKAAESAAADISRYIDLLRLKAGKGLPPPKVIDANGPAPDDSVPIILLASRGDSLDRNGFTWRAGRERIEIYGDSDRGLCRGVYDFLGALGIRWPSPESEEIPSPPLREGLTGSEYPLASDRAYTASSVDFWKRKRFLLRKGETLKKQELLIRWAARTGQDALVVSLLEKRIPPAAEHYAFVVERGGHEISLLVPRRLFLFKRRLFAMAGGKRVKRHHFCPTEPDTGEVIAGEGKILFSAALDACKTRSPGENTAPYSLIVNLWPDRDAADQWCSCPACRAFSTQEQYSMAVNIAADTLSQLDPAAKIGCLIPPVPEDEALPKKEIPLRSNVVILQNMGN